MGGADSRARRWRSGLGARLTCLPRVRGTHCPIFGGGGDSDRRNRGKSLSTDPGGDVAASSGCYSLLDGAHIGVSWRAKSAAPRALDRPEVARECRAGWNAD